MVDRKYYEKYMSTDIAADFLEKRNHIRVVLGCKDCINLINPSLYYCHIRGCHMPEVKLRNFNSLTDVVNHWKNHDSKESSYRFDPTVNILLRRHLELKELKLKIILEDDIQEALSSLENVPVDLGINNRLLFKGSPTCKDSQG